MEGAFSQERQSQTTSALGNEEIAKEDLWERLPSELLRIIVEASSRPLHVYVQLLGLSQTIRSSVRGTLRELSFAEPDLLLDDITITVDALAALLGPCKSLRKLSFPSIIERWWDFNQTASAASWVDEAFGGHTQLAVLALPSSLPELDVERILCHLPGLVELTVDPCQRMSTRLLAMSTRLLAALARSCPGLQVLRCTFDECDCPDFAALTPLSGVLKVLDIQGKPRSGESLGALVGNLTAVTSLTFPPRCPPVALMPIASHLTSLELSDFIPGPWLCRLETLSLYLSHELFSPLARLLAANQATLRSLRLKLDMNDDNKASPILMGALCALPHLTHLNMFGDSCSLVALLPPPDLVNRLERLQIVCNNVFDHLAVVAPVRIASSRLQHLCLEAMIKSWLELRCPALVDLDLHDETRALVLHCPRLRTLTIPATHSLDRVSPLPELEVFEHPSFSNLSDPAWLLTGPKPPRLQVLSRVRLTQPDLLASLCACRSLVRLERLRLDVTRLPNPLVLRLPGQLERLDLHLETSPQAEAPPLLDLQVEAPGLLDFALNLEPDFSLPSVRVRLSDSPSLVRLTLYSDTMQSEAHTIALQTDAGTPAVAMQPRSLSLEGDIEVAGLVGFLARHGSRLRSITLRVEFRAEDWPQLVGALSGLTRLTRLHLRLPKALSHLSLACPHLRVLSLHKMRRKVKVVLACPLLEQLRGISHSSSQLTIALPAPNLDPNDELSFPSSSASESEDLEVVVDE
ncbi:hypothetical protein PAPYR_548 [Paratrimastix pyriformis]|uniref:Uncharacterized protein n=1 Tax=Paratrimastix pyriformis TaxID=342808 RepID=A0ABQ8UWS6_9EUKA|nr:hypothetical protein PAPYR_548 [Paratrimastix pyriformis]